MLLGRGELEPIDEEGEQESEDKSFGSEIENHMSK